jgi:hypothetical protein
VIHGKEGWRGSGRERDLKVTRKESWEEEWTVRYQLTDPVKITMTEKVELVEKMVNFVGEVTRVVNMSTRFLKTC